MVFYVRPGCKLAGKLIDFRGLFLADSLNYLSLDNGMINYNNYSGF